MPVKLTYAEEFEDELEVRIKQNLARIGYELK